MCSIFVHCVSGEIITIEYDSWGESAFEALQRKYDSDPDFMIYDINKITFEK